MASTTVNDANYPCSLTIHIPFPTHRLASAALGTLSVDRELSDLVTRSFTLVAPDAAQSVQSDPLKGSLLVNAAPTEPVQPSDSSTIATEKLPNATSADESKTVLRTEYKATTNRMLRVAVNGFFESLGVIVHVMEELDSDVLHEKGIEGLEGVQGVEQGMTGTTVAGG
ncbi:hypothetical protein MBLNU230_g7007t1 [Neophaeotheca triangularis]